MSSNITQFPLMEEYLRAYPVAIDGKVQSATLYPLRQFRVPTSEIIAVITHALEESNKMFDGEDGTTASQSLNYHINAGVIRLIDEGKVIVADKFQGMVTNHLNAAFNGRGIVETCDGYTVFNPGHIPPTPSPRYH